MIKMEVYMNVSWVQMLELPNLTQRLTVGACFFQLVLPMLASALLMDGQQSALLSLESKVTTEVDNIHILILQ